MITIITDSSSELLKDAQEKYNVKVLPMPINFGETTYLSGVTISNEEFYRQLKNSAKLPTTSMINSYTFKEAFDEEIKKGNDVVVITVSSKLSATYSQADAAAKEVSEKNIFVVDSLNASMGESVIVLEAVKLRDRGKSAKEIFESLNKIVPNVRVIAMVDTLKYLKAGGRLSGSAALIGTVLNVKPLVSVEEGKVVSKSKAIGKSKAFKSISTYIKNYSIDKNKSVILAYANDIQIKNEFQEYLKKDCNLEIDEAVQIGSTIGVHVGPGAVGVAFVEDNKN